MSHHDGAHRGIGQVGAENFDAAAAVGGWRGVAESVLPTLVFVIVMSLRPSALLPALAASLAVSGAASLARLIQRQPLTQVAGGTILALISAAWAWRSGQASDFYATGLLINAGFLLLCLASVLARWPLVGVFVGVWEQTSQDDPAGWAAWRTAPERRAQRRQYTVGTLVLAAMFGLRLVVEVPLYLAGESALAALGVARLVLGVPLYALTLWFVWLLVRPRPGRHGGPEDRD